MPIGNLNEKYDIYLHKTALPAAPKTGHHPDVLRYKAGYFAPEKDCLFSGKDGSVRKWYGLVLKENPGCRW